MTNEFFRESLCQNQYLHRFKIVDEFPEGVLEVCEICGKDKFFKIYEGKLNNYEYMSYHIREALPPIHPYYFHEWSYNPLSDRIVSIYG